MPSIGHIGEATFRLTATFQQDLDTKTITDTATAGKYESRSVMINQKFSNKELIESVLSYSSFSRSKSIRADDFKVKYVKELGFFIVSKDGEFIQFIGGSNTTDLPINITSTGVSLTDEKITTTETRINYSVQTTTQTGFSRGLETTHFIFKPVPFITITGVGLTDYNIASFTNETAKFAASAFRSIVADDDDDEGVIITGSINLTAMEEVDLTPYFEAYFNAINPI